MQTLARIWDDFWFKESTGRSEAWFRVGYSFALLGDLIGMRSKVVLLFSNEGVHHATPLDVFYPPAAVLNLHAAWIVIVALLLLGVRTRLMSVLNFFLTTYFFSLRGYGASHVADWAHQAFGFCLIWQTSGRFLSVEKFWKKERDVRPLTLWPVRLTQITIGCIYFTSGISKVADPGWLAGTAFLDTLRTGHLSYFDLSWLPEHPVFHAINYAVMAWESLIPFLWFFPLARPWAVLTSFFFHAGIWLLVRVGWFTETMIGSLFIFIDDCFPPKNRTIVPPAAEAPLIPLVSWGWCKRACINVFLCFHLFAVGSAQIAYAGKTFDPYGSWWQYFKAYPLSVRVYVNNVCRLVYFNLWPSPIFFDPLKIINYRAFDASGRPASIPPFDENGRFVGGLRYAKEARLGLLLTRMGNYGLNEKQWNAFLRQLVAFYQKEHSHAYPSRLQIYRVEVFPKRAAEGNAPRTNIVPLAEVKVRETPQGPVFNVSLTGPSPVLPPGETWYRQGDLRDWLDKLTARYGIGF
ncbi:MAG TPA: HTTM domain-containing protein [Verrucomicrobiae bacterium]|jgi:hypothetical protein|nr:HTTM domain-containing protein [Verrucomicrobiae bacterium]